MPKHESIQIVMHGRSVVALHNLTDIEPAALKLAAAYALRGIDLHKARVPALTVRVRRVSADSPADYGTYTAYADDARGQVRPLIEVNLHDGLFQPTTGLRRCPMVMPLPGRLLDRFGLMQMLLFSELEYLVFIMGHEARHLWQHRISGRPWARPEYDADRHGLRVLMRFRREHGPARDERTIQTQPPQLARTA